MDIIFRNKEDSQIVISIYHATRAPKVGDEYFLEERLWKVERVMFFYNEEGEESVDTYVKSQAGDT